MERIPYYPDGKLGPNDEGELAIRIEDIEGRVTIQFSKKIAWLGFDKNGLRDFINGLVSHYKRMR